MADWWKNDLTAPGASLNTATQPAGEPMPPVYNAPDEGQNGDWYKKDLTADGTHLNGIPDSQAKAGRDVGIGGTFVAGFRSDDDEGLRYYAQKLFPDEPIDDAVKRFTKTDKNRVVYQADDGNYYDAQPSSGVRETISRLGNTVGKMIPMTAATVAGIATAPMAGTGIGLAGSMSATASAGAAGEALRQKLGDYMMGDASTGDLNKMEIAKEGALSGIGQGIGVGFGKVIEKNQVRDIDRLSKDYMDKAYNEAGKRGIDLTPGQATGLKTLQAEEKRIATRVPETVDQMSDFIAKQSDDVQNAWYKELNNIAPSKDASEVGSSVRRAAQSALDDVVKARKGVAKPLYDAWKQQRAPVDTTPVLDAIKGEIKDSARGGLTSSSLSKVRNFLTNAKGRPVTDPVKLHNARIELGNMIETRSVDGTSINNTIAGKLKGIMKDLTRQMDDASMTPDGVSLYGKARGSFSDLSSDVTDAFSSSLERIANLKDTSILSTVREAFNPSTRSPEMIKKLGEKLATKDPQAWQGLKRLWLQDEIGGKLKITESGDIANSAGKILKALEDPGLRRSASAALSGAEKQNLEDLRFVLKRIANANLRMGSDTAANQAADRIALDRATPLWAKAQKALLNFWDIPKDVAKSSGERNMASQAKKMVDIVTSGDRNGIKAIKELRKLSPKQWRALAASGQLGTRGVSALAGRAIAPPPPSLNPPEAQPN